MDLKFPGMNIIYPLLLLEWLLTSTVYKPVLINNDTYSLAGNDTPKIIEKVYLHTDRNYYYPGDDIWFKTYLVEASDNHLSDNSNNLHVEFISPANKIIDSRIVRIENGLGKGDFAAPKDLQSGRYRLRAYTNYMRNFGDRAFFNKEISVINPLEADVKTDSSIRYIEDRISISFFPEGGSLVDNIPSKVAFKAVDASGKGCDSACPGLILQEGLCWWQMHLMKRTG